jgi:hypothetical protein
MAGKPHNRRDLLALGTTVAAVLIANGPYLLGLFDANQLWPLSELVSAVKPGRLVGLPTIDPSTGFISQALGHRAMLQVIHLQAPWWNPYEGIGSPLAGEMESAALFAPTLLTLLANGQLYEHILLESLAGCFTFLLARRLGIGRVAATAGGIAFAFNGTFAWLSHAPVNAVVLLPALLLGIELAFDATVGARRGGWWLIAAAGALSAYAGFPETALIDTVLAVVWAIWRLCCIQRARVAALLGKLALGALAATLLAAPLLIAIADYLPHAYIGAHASSAYGSEHLGALGLPALVIPYIYGPIFAFDDPHLRLATWWGSVGGFLTISLVMFALVGLIGPGRRGLKVTLAIWITLSLARIYGLPVLGGVLGLVPGMSHVEFGRWSWPALEIAVVVLAALGLDQLRERTRHVRVIAPALLVAGGALAAAALGARAFTPHLGSAYAAHPFFEDSLLWSGCVLAAGAAATLLGRPRLRIALAALVLVADTGAMFALPELSAPRSVTPNLAPVRYLRAHLGAGRFFTLGPLAPNYGSYFGLAELNVNDIPIPAAMRRLINARLAPDSNPLTFVGNTNGPGEPTVPTPEQQLLDHLGNYRAVAVDYVLTPPGMALPTNNTGLKLAAQTPSAWIYHLSGAAPLVSVIRGSCALSATTVTSVRAVCRSPALLLLRELYLPGASASVDGHQLPVRRAPAGFEEIRVARGLQRISFGYAPPLEDLGLAALAAGLALMLWPWPVTRLARGLVAPRRAARRTRPGAQR